jgi:F-type H+-transporting ATPase subunit b
MNVIRTMLLSGSTLAANAAIAVAQAGESVEVAAKPTDIRFNVMLYVLVIFLIFAWILKRYFMAPIIGAVEKREKALEEAIEGAKRDREAAAALLAEQQSQIEGARAEAQRLIADGRATAEKLRHELAVQGRKEQQEAIERARNEIQREKDRAVADIRREAVDLAIAGASRVIEQNLDSAANRSLVETYLGSLKPGSIS